jgi:hypothetical protein
LSSDPLTGGKGGKSKAHKGETSAETNAELQAREMREAAAAKAERDAFEEIKR